MDFQKFYEGLNQDFMIEYPPKKNQLKFTNPNKFSPEKYHREMHEIDELIIHCTATDSAGWETPEACIEYDISPGNHISASGLALPTYHFYINKAGNVWQLLSMEYWTNNCSGHNRNSIAIVINHGAVIGNVTKQQYEALLDTVAYVFDFMDWSYDEYGIAEHLFFHRDFNKFKSCPGKIDRNSFMRDAIARLKQWGDNK